MIADSLTLVVLAEAAVALGPTVESSASASADCLVVDLLAVEVPSCLSFANRARTEAVRLLAFLQYLLDLRTPAPLPCKDILGSYTYVGAVPAQAHSLFSLASESTEKY